MARWELMYHQDTRAYSLRLMRESNMKAWCSDDASHLKRPVVSRLRRSGQSIVAESGVLEVYSKDTLIKLDHMPGPVCEEAGSSHITMCCAGTSP